MTKAKAIENALFFTYRIERFLEDEDAGEMHIIVKADIDKVVDVDYRNDYREEDYYSFVVTQDEIKYAKAIRERKSYLKDTIFYLFFNLVEYETTSKKEKVLKVIAMSTIFGAILVAIVYGIYSLFLMISWCVSILGVFLKTHSYIFTRIAPILAGLCTGGYVYLVRKKLSKRDSHDEN